MHYIQGELEMHHFDKYVDGRDKDANGQKYLKTEEEKKIIEDSLK